MERIARSDLLERPLLAIVEFSARQSLPVSGGCCGSLQDRDGITEMAAPFVVVDDVLCCAFDAEFPKARRNGAAQGLKRGSNRIDLANGPGRIGELFTR